jgi:glucose/arabinose dehydrogenase
MHAPRMTKTTRAFAAIAAAALMAGGITAAATAAGAAPAAKPVAAPTHSPKAKLAATKLSIANKAIAHGRHHADAITGVLRSHGTGLANEPVTLEARSGVKPRWTVVATETTGTGGTVTFTVSPKVKTQFKLVFAGTSSYRKSASNVITLLRVK